MSPLQRTSACVLGRKIGLGDFGLVAGDDLLEWGKELALCNDNILERPEPWRESLLAAPSGAKSSSISCAIQKGTITPEPRQSHVRAMLP